jgi:small-conductance mechanosensitive channel
MKMKGLCLIAGLAFLVLTIFTMPVSAQKLVARRPAENSSPKVDVKDLEALASTIENDQTRQQLLDQIRALIAVDRKTAAKRDERPLSVRLAEGAMKTLEEASQSLAKAERYFRYTPIMVAWFREEISNPATLSRNAKKALPFVWIFGIAWFVEFVVVRLLAGPRKRSAERAHGSLAARLPISVGVAALRLCGPAAFAAAALAVFFFLQPGEAIGQPAFQVFAAYITGRLLMIFVHMVLAPSAPSLRLVPLSPEFAHSLYVWIRRLVTFAIVGYLLFSMATLLGLPPVALGAFENLLLLILEIMLIVLIVKNRSAVAERIRREDLSIASSAAGQVIRGSLAAVWHIVGIFYVMAFAFIWWQRIEGGVTYLLRSTLLSAVVVLAAWLLVKGFRRAAARVWTIGDERRREFTSLKHRIKIYLPALFGIIRGAVALLLILSILEVWKLDAYNWLTTPAVSRILSVCFSIFLVVGVALAIWEAVNIATERYLVETEESGKKSGQGARTRTLLPLMRKALLLVLSIIVVLIVLSEIGIHIGPFLAGAGIIGLAIGFGAQKLVQDIITGVFILVENAVSVGDVVTVAGIGGLVEDLSIRSIRLRDLSGNVHTIPFSSVETVTNMTKVYSYYLLDIGVAYREDTDEVANVCRQIVKEMRAEPKFGREILEPLEVLGVDRFADSAVILKARIKTRPIKQWMVGREFNRRMKKRFDELGIEIPFPHRTLYFGADKMGQAPPEPIGLKQKESSAGRGQGS